MLPNVPPVVRLLVALLILAAWGCGGKGEPAAETPSPKKSAPAASKTPAAAPSPGSSPAAARTEGDGGLFSMILPKGMAKVSSLNSEASLQAEDPKKELYLVVLTDAKEDLEPGLATERYSEITRKLLLEKAKVKDPGKPRTLRVGGQAGLQHEIRAEVDGREVVYLHTVVEGPNRFYQIVASTLASRYDDNKPLMQALIASWQAKG